MNCSVYSCSNLVKTKGLCASHYQMQWRNGRTFKVNTGDKRNHPFYSLWFERKQSKILCDSWLNFWNFVWDISPKPEGNYLLVRLRDAPFGPDNFKWQEHLKRKETETKKEWHARKWAARQLANPSMERERNYFRKYGITLNQYNELAEKQNFVCAVCGNAETSVDGKTGSKKKLAVDHCHKTNKVRELLCWRCNGTIGKIDESIELLQAMINYLLKHKEL